MESFQNDLKKQDIMQKTSWKDVDKRYFQSVNFSEAAVSWLQFIKNMGNGRKHSTYIKYRDIYLKFLAEPLRRIRIQDIDIVLLEDRVFSSFQSMQELSESRLNSIFCVVNQILSYASERYHVPTTPLKRNTYRKKQKKPVEIFNQSELRKLICCLYRNIDMNKLGILLCLSTGLRLGEICAMRWEDIDLKQKLLHVRRTVQRISIENENSKTALIETEPKSLYSKREIPLSNQMAELLSFYSESNGYLLCGIKPKEPRTYQNSFKRILKEAGLPNRNFHTLRHTFATNCIGNGTDIKSLSEILGHSDVKITLNRYVHPTMETKRQYMNSLAAIYVKYSFLD